MTLTNTKCDSERNIADVARDLASQMMHGFDSSHDMLHVSRVENTARKLAMVEKDIDITVVQLGAILHDVLDHKYCKETLTESRLSLVKYCLTINGLEPLRVEQVLKIIQNVGFSLEKKLKRSGNWSLWHETCKEFHCVQDADRLDAIGAMGIFRAAAYSCAKQQPLYSPNPEVNSAYQHFYDKLLGIKDNLRMPAAQRAGRQRQLIMEEFLKAADQEFLGADIF